MKKVILFFSVLFLFSGFNSVSFSQNREILIKFKPDVSDARRDSILQQLHVTLDRELKSLRIAVCRLPQNSAMETVQKKAEEFAEIEYSEANVSYRTLDEQTVQKKIQEKLPFKLADLDKFTIQPEQVIVKYKFSATIGQIDQFTKSQGYTQLKHIPRLGAHVYKTPAGQKIRNVVIACAVENIVDYVEPNYIVRAFDLPNDPKLKDQWGLFNKDDHDIDAPEAWQIQTGDPAVSIGIVDTGIDYNHEDLRDRYWHNSGEMGDGKENNGIDDDDNGYVDDWRGWDFKGRDNNPMDDNGHGTHCAGIAAATGNNGKGGTGVAWHASLIALKFLGMDGSGTVADAAEAIVYGTDNGIKILSNSWGGTDYSQTLEDAVKYAASRSVLFLAAAGNDKEDNDSSPHYPCNLTEENVISVAASDEDDRPANFSNYGAKSVDIAAPGTNIVSTYLHNKYEILSGTSMATPFVSGTAALIRAEFPGISMHYVKLRLLGGVDYPGNWEGLTLTGGRLNAAKSLSHSPIVALPVKYKDTKDTAGPYKISAYIIDDSSLASVKLIYYFNNFSQKEILQMKMQGNDKYEAGIPGQAYGSAVSYYIVAEDYDTNRTASRVFHFKVSETGNGCCGGAAFAAAQNDNNRIFTGAVLLANLFIVIVPWGLLRRFYGRK
ncbi:MAG TPA: hypothetical protein ENH29_11040 [Bacteroidetes bacterium]|nr:hypothetical protein [Bacteroidota bacterium]